MPLCACDCGTQAHGGVFAPGHDQALRARLEKNVGGLLLLKELLAVAEAYANGDSDLEQLGKSVRRIYLNRATH